MVKIVETVDPSYIRKQLVGRPKLSEEEIGDLILRLLDTQKTLPTKEAYDKGAGQDQKISAIISMTVSDFLTQYDDPHKHFSRQAGPVTEAYKDNAFYHLRRLFPRESSGDVKDIFTKNNQRFVPTAKELEDRNNREGKRRMEILDT